MKKDLTFVYCTDINTSTTQDNRVAWVGEHA